MRSHREFEWILSLAIACTAPLAAQPDPAQAARSLEHEGKTAEALAAWRTLARQYPRNPEPFAHLGMLEARQEHYTEAIADYKRALALAPTASALHLNLGLAYFKQGSYSEALVQLEPLQKANPADPRLNILVGMAHYGLGHYAQAAPFLRSASAADPANAALLLTLAHACLYVQQYSCVLDAYHQLIALNAESAEVDMLVGEALDEMKDKDGAIREFRAAIEANPKEPNVHFGLGYLLWTQSAYPEAAQQFAAELVNDTGHTTAQLYLADSQIQMEQFEAALSLLEPLVKAEPQNFKAHLDLGIIYAELKRNTDAIREYHEAARLKPEDANVHWRLGRLYRSMGRAEEAKAEFARTGDLNKAAGERLLKIMSTLPARKPAPLP